MHRFSERGQGAEINYFFAITGYVNNAKHLGIKLENKFGCILKQGVRGKQGWLHLQTGSQGKTRLLHLKTGSQGKTSLVAS